MVYMPFTSRTSQTSTGVSTKTSMNRSPPTMDADLVPGRREGADQRTDRHALVPDHLGRHEPDAQDVRDPVLLAETQALGEVRPDHIAVQGSVTFLPADRSRGARISAIVDFPELGSPVSQTQNPWRRLGRIRLVQDLRHLRMGEPFGKPLAPEQGILDHVRCRYADILLRSVHDRSESSYRSFRRADRPFPRGGSCVRRSRPQGRERTPGRRAMRTRPFPGNPCPGRGDRRR